MLEIRVRILVQARVRRLATSIGSVESILAGFIRFQFRHKVPYHAFVRVFLGHMFQRNEHFLPYRVEMQKTIDPPLEDLRAGPQKRGLICKDVCMADLILVFKTMHMRLTALWAVEGPPFRVPEQVLKQEIKLFCQGLRVKK